VEAIAAFREVLTLLRSDKNQSLQNYKWLQKQLDEVKILPEIEPVKDQLIPLWQASTHLSSWLLVRDINHVAEIQILLGDTLMLLSKRTERDESASLLGEAKTTFQEVVTDYREVLKGMKGNDYFKSDLASIQVSLGSALVSYSQTAKGAERLRLLEEAFRAYQEALEIFTREQMPQWRAMTQGELGTVFLLHGMESKGAEMVRVLGQAVEAYRENLKVITREEDPKAWAILQIQMGSTLTIQAVGSEGSERTRLAAEAVAAFHPVLKVVTREQLPQEWARTHVFLGMALVLREDRAEGAEGVRLLEEAVAACREALKVYSREDWPKEWMITQLIICIVLQAQGDRAEGLEGVRLLEEVVDAYREVLKVVTLEDWPQQWAITQKNLGTVLFRQAVRAAGAEGVRLLGEAVAAYREALKVYTREEYPQDWAAMQNNLGKIYERLSDWSNAAQSFANVLSLYPNYQEGYQSLATVYHERLFDYQNAFDLHQRWLTQNLQDTSVLPGYAETHFTTGRFTEYSQRASDLLSNTQLSAGASSALRMIEVANLLVLDRAAKVPAALSDLDKFISGQKEDFSIGWTFNGTLSFINNDKRFEPYRAWLNEFFGIASAKNRDAIIKALREVQRKFKK